VKNEEGRWVVMSRRRYLAKLGLKPRDEIMGSRHAGWKNPACDQKWYVEVRWFDPDYGKLFLHLWNKYYLPQILPLRRNHPYAWVTFEGKNPGGMYALAHYRKAHTRAVKSIGLVPRRADGTKPHGHRHAYEHRLERAGVSMKTIKNCMHHGSLSSQTVYSKDDIARMSAELNEGNARLASGGGKDAQAFMDRWRSEVEALDADLLLESRLTRPKSRNDH
jgi:hypothetical protein